MGLFIYLTECQSSISRNGWQFEHSHMHAVHRFAARRGQPKSIISQNWTNLETLETDETATSLAQHGIKWTFNPPAAPHFGAVWKGPVRSYKNATFNVLEKQFYLRIDLKQNCVVQQMNRPITVVSGDITDNQSLIPNLFPINHISVISIAFLFLSRSAGWMNTCLAYSNEQNGLKNS